MTETEALMEIRSLVTEANSRRPMGAGWYIPTHRVVEILGQVTPSTGTSTTTSGGTTIGAGVTLRL